MGFNRIVTATILAGAILAPFPSFATVDFQLSELPKDRNLRRCQAWAMFQHDAGTLRVWGRTKDAKISNSIALLRLALYCLGDDPPDIVFFGTSAGFNDRFCADHKADQICKN